MLECVEKEEFQYSDLKDEQVETASEAGLTAQFLQKRTYDRLMATRS